MVSKTSFICLTLLLSRAETVASFAVGTKSVGALLSPPTTANDHGSTHLTWQLSAGSDDLFGDESSSRKVSSEEDPAENYSGRFATGKDLKRLHADLDSLRENLSWAQAMEDENRIDDLNKAIKNGENRDPNIVYKRALRAVIDAKASFKLSEEEKARRVKKWKKEAEAARLCLPRFQMEGLWVGSYGEHGMELINVTYTGDTLIATKLTGDENVPRGQTSFSSDLSPSNSTSLEPLKVSFDREASQLMRYLGKGQIAKRGFTNKKFVEGQLVMFDKHFSFVWIPTRHHVLFRRPTPEQTISLLRDIIAKEDEVENMRAHLTRCLDMDMTDSLARFHANKGQEPFRRIMCSDELEAIEMKAKGCKLPSTNNNHVAFNFWHIHKWRGYIDRVLGEKP